MQKGKIVSLEDRIPKIKQQRRKKANRRLILLLSLFFSLTVCVVYFQSPLSHVKKVNIIGNSVYASEYLTELSGLSSKTNIWKINEVQIEEEFEKLSEIKTAKVEVRLPNQVVITVEEWKRIAYITKETEFLPVLESGDILEDEKMSTIPVNAPILVGFSEGEVISEMVQSLEGLPEEVLNSISEIHYSPKDTDKFHISLFMNDGFEVSASIRSFTEKMSHYPSIVSQLDPTQKGVIDLEVGSYFRAYESEGAEVDENEDER
ncbi:cell division protein FtsQ/DivIB [Cytobacillus sp. FJAT-54145]|uniref:Cell division protein DivIB n=1 Tax=Cytobacillus spartinae TaxID=3299023 RepID=A0ABW6KK90_9BACI